MNRADIWSFRAVLNRLPRGYVFFEDADDVWMRRWDNGYTGPPEEVRFRCECFDCFAHDRDEHSGVIDKVL